MGGIILFCLFSASGIPLAELAFPRSSRGIKLWLGLVFGQVMMLWLPSLFAFFHDFTAAAQWSAAAAAVSAAIACTLIRLFPRRKSAPDSPELATARETEPPAWLICALVIPLGLVMAYLQYTHILLPDEYGFLHTGQATNGDLNLHIAIASCLAHGGQFPPDYPIFDGVRLGYNFLCDALSASMMTAGSSLQTSFILPGVFHTVLAAWGFLMFAWEASRSKRAAALAFLLLFLNGGLGFFYIFDQVGADASRVQEMLWGFYRAPANMTDHNIRWSNLLCDMLLPQRAFAPGWMMLTACLWMLLRAMRTKETKRFAILGLLAGCMPMVHAHSLFSLALISLGAMGYCFFHKKRITGKFWLYAGITALLVLPQAAYWILPQASAEGSMHLRFNWINNESGRLTDDWLWFWVKNVGPVFLIFLPAYFTAPARLRPLLLGAGLVFVAADLVVFQKNIYDNNKIFYAAFLTALPAAAVYLLKIYDRLRDIPGRRALAAVFVAVSVLSGALSVVREALSDYILYTPTETQAMAWIEENTPRDALFLTGDQYDNPVCGLAGRNILCGTSSFLYYHSIGYESRTYDEYAMLQAPAEHLDLFAAYGIDYVYVGDYELTTCHADIEALSRLFETVYDSGAYIFRVPQKSDS